MKTVQQIHNARVFLGGSFVEGGLSFDEKILDCGPQITDGDIDAGGAYLIPGLIDIHTHGAMGEDASDGRAEGLAVMARYYAAQGVTSWCPTTMTLSEPVLTDAMTAIRNSVRPENGAKIAGIHLEGPFLNAAKRGAQAEEGLCAPDIGMFHRLNEASGGLIRLVTVAPEEPGAIPFIREASKVCTVSLGHTTADYATAAAAYAAGASHATHLFNAMPPLHHREPGVVAAAYDAGASAELICDGLHIHPAVVRMVFALFGERTVLITDSLRCAGMPDGEYLLGGQPVTLKAGRATLMGTDILAGSRIHLMDGLRNAIAFGVPLPQAVTAATSAPARAIGREREIGAIAPGLSADFLLLDRNLTLRAVYVNGREIAP